MANYNRGPRWTDKLRAVVDYIQTTKDMDIVEAMKKAGYKEKYITQNADKVRKHPFVADAIAKAIEERSERTKIDADALLVRLQDEANADLADIYDKNMQLKKIHDMPLVWRQGLLAGIEVTSIGNGDDAIGQVTKVKLSDRIKRLELIGKHVDVKAWIERVQTVQPDNKDTLYEELAELLGLGPAGKDQIARLLGAEESHTTH
ncbi:MAG: terminase small subunit [Candidatus Thiodiazotropha lotti]|nr:terminase small subunit [Candidatus Thiodiazotropha lotti]MCW4221807.1 terminase small subunit [Candidatus Thiodiazotropha lotti]